MAKIPEMKVNIDLDKIAKGIILESLFNQVNIGFLRFDKEADTFLINENVLMQAIQLINPLQEPRKLKLVSQEEWLDRRG